MANILTALSGWSVTEASNQPDSTDSATIAGDLRAIQSGVRYIYSQDTIASAATTDLGSKDAGSLTISGTTTITALGTVSAGIRKSCVFSGILTLTHNGTSLILPGAANITTAANDRAEFESLGSGNWRCNWYVKASGLPVINPLSDGDKGDIVVTSSGATWTLDNAFVNDLTTVTIASGDHVAIADVSDSGNKKKALVSDIIALSRSVISHKSGNYTVVQADNGGSIIVDAAATITLPAISTLTLPFEVTIKQGAANGTAISIAKNVADDFGLANVALAASLPLGGFSDSVTLVADSTGSRWQVVSDMIHGPFIYVHRNGTNQTGIVTATDTKVQWTTEAFDFYGCFDNATNYRFTPSIPGTYLFQCGVTWISIGDQSNLKVALFKNGAQENYMEHSSSGAGGQASCFSGSSQANGTTDYFEIFVSQNSGVNRDINGAAVGTWLKAQRLK